MESERKRKRGRPRGPLNPEYQEVLRLYLAGVRPCEIGPSLGRSVRWAHGAVLELRRRGALSAGDHVAAGRTPKWRTQQAE